MTAPRVELAGLTIADVPERWRELGFAVGDGDRCPIGGVDCTLGAAGKGITGWTLRRGPAARGDTAASGHPNGALAVDHVVIVTPDFDGSAGWLAEQDMELRRIRRAGDRRQGFRRLGPTILELVEAPEAPGQRFWGLTVVVADLAALARANGHVSDPRPAVQAGRQIAVVDRAAGLTTRLAFMDPE
jgi:hypothetical protein